MIRNKVAKDFNDPNIYGYLHFAGWCNLKIKKLACFLFIYLFAVAVAHICCHALSTVWTFYILLKMHCKFFFAVFPKQSFVLFMWAFFKSIFSTRQKKWLEKLEWKLLDFLNHIWTCTWEQRKKKNNNRKRVFFPKLHAF